MNCLAMHVTEAQGSVAVGRRDGVAWASEFTAQGDKAPILLLQIERLLARAEMTPTDITNIAVTTGPGSFTGIRIGLATAQGLALARGWELFACDSLKAVAAAQRAGDTPQATADTTSRTDHAVQQTGDTVHLADRLPIAVVLDARRGEVYAALYDCSSDGRLRARIAPQCTTPETAAANIAAACRVRGPFWIAGSGVALVLPALVVAGAEAKPAPAAPRSVAAALIDLARDGGCEPVAAADLEPVYLRLSDAESKRAHGV